MSLSAISCRENSRSEAISSGYLSLALVHLRRMRLAAPELFGAKSFRVLAGSEMRPFPFRQRMHWRYHPFHPRRPWPAHPWRREPGRPCRRDGSEWRLGLTLEEPGLALLGLGLGLGSFFPS